MEVYIKELPYVEPYLMVRNFSEDINFVFLDSATRSTKNDRFSYIAFDPYSVISCVNGLVFIDGVKSKATPLEILTKQISLYSFADRLPFSGGLVGYLGYEFSNYIEPLINFKKPRNIPDMMMGVFDLIIAFDHISKQCWVYSSGLPETNESSRKKRAEERCRQLISYIQTFSFADHKTLENIVTEAEINSNLNYEEYCAVVDKVLNYIRAGDIYQANIAQRFECVLPQEINSLHIYDRLRRKNPAPFSAYLKLNDVVIASASPERFISAQEGYVATCPIKGTYPRSRNVREDKRLAHELFHCEKNRAENLMIVDLMRNDLSRVCELFSVKVPSLFCVESYATVHHLVSTVCGKLKRDKNIIDLISATFPGGSITGAPKIRAMEIIEELEPHARGPYCGSLGYFGFNGGMDTSILIRTFVIKDRVLTFHVGGGIVADSTPHQEYLETLIKANALYATLTGHDINLEVLMKELA